MSQLEPAQAIEADPARLIVSALLWATPAEISAAIDQLDDDDLSSPHAEIVEAIDTLARRGETGTAAIQSELLRAGLYAGPFRRELEAAPMAGGTVAGLSAYVTALVARRFRERVGAYGRALDEAADNIPEAELWDQIVEGGRELRKISARLEKLRGGEL